MEVARAHRRMPTTGRFSLAAVRPRQQQPHHEGVVVGSPDEVEECDRVEHHQGEQLGAVPVVEAGQPGDAPGDQQDPDQRQEPEQDHRGQLVVEGDPGEETVDLQEQGAVGGRGVAPELVDRRGVGVVAQLEGTVEVRVHVVADHLALGRVGVDVAAEQGCDDQHGGRPQGEDPHHLLDGHAGTAGVEAGHPPPHPHQQEQAAVDGGQGEVHAPLGSVGGAGLAEEPRHRASRA